MRDVQTVPLEVGDVVNYEWTDKEGKVVQQHSHTATRKQVATGAVESLPNNELNIFFTIRNID